MDYYQQIAQKISLCPHMEGYFTMFQLFLIFILREYWYTKNKYMELTFKI
jgi:hypothetical protein